MIKAEGEIEGGIAEPGAFGVEEHRPSRASKNVLRTDVAVNQRALRRERHAASSSKRDGKLGMGTGRRAQIGLDADRLERLVIGERGRNGRVGGAPRMDDCEIAADRGGEIHVHDPGKQLRLP